ncbi:MAG: FecR domain-containing protein, partial [Chthoniobacterales bacterium]
VKQKVNVVTIAPTLTAAARPARQGSLVQDENVVRTGAQSRAELEFTDLTLARLGANSIFSFDAQARAITCNQGSALFAKPSNSGKVEVRAGAITAAITGSTGFISNRKVVARGRRHNGDESGATMVGMLEGKLNGSSTWQDASGREHRFSFKLGPGEMIVARGDRPPVVMQFDIPRFLKTSPLVNAFNSELPNSAQLNRAVADYNADVRRGFVDAGTARTSGSGQFGWMSSVDHNAFDASVNALSGGSGTPGFVDVGGDGLIRGQLVWETFADLDLHLLLPDSQHVFYANRSVSFNNGQAVAMLDNDNLGGTIDVPPSRRVENIVVTGTPSAGVYQFYVNSFSTPNSSDFYTLTIRSGSNVQTVSGNLGAGQTSQIISVNFPGR